MFELGACDVYCFPLNPQCATQLITEFRKKTVSTDRFVGSNKGSNMRK